jgi:CheY-like chemotaxis protein
MKKPTILCVDDDRITLSFLKNALSDNYNVVVTNNSDQAFELIVRLHPDLLITDIVMAEMSGFELADLIKQVKGREKMPVIVLSSYDEQQMLEKFNQSGLSLFFKKPVTIEVLNSGIQQLLNTQPIADH